MRKSCHCDGNTYVFTADDRSLTSAGVVRAAILVDAPIAGPLSFDTRRARCVTRAVVIGKVTADEILVGLRGSHLENFMVGSSLSSSYYQGNNKYGYSKDTHTLSTDFQVESAGISWFQNQRPSFASLRGHNRSFRLANKGNRATRSERKGK
jgi:hypothetical protein